MHLRIYYSVEVNYAHVHFYKELYIFLQTNLIHFIKFVDMGDEHNRQPGITNVCKSFNYLVKSEISSLIKY